MKQTEIGLIPDDWEVKTLGDVAEIKTGPFGSALHASDYVLIGTPIITVEHIGTISIRKDIDIPMVNEIDRERLKAYSLITGDLIFSRVGAVDRNCVVSDKESGWLFSGRLLRVRLNKSVIPLYMSYHLSMKDSKDRILSVAVGLAMPSINTKILSGLKIVLPPLAEQQRIAKALSDIDALISTTEKLIQKKKNIKQGTMQNLLTGKKRLPGFAKSIRTKMTELGEIPEDWEVKTLGEVAHIIMGQSPNSDCYNTQNGMVLIQGNADISNRKTICRFYTTHITKTARKGDVIFTVRAPVGNVAKATFDCCLGRGVCALQELSYFLYYYLIFIEDSWSKTSTGSTFDSINSDTLASTLVIKPSLKKEQTAIANVLSSMDKEIETLNTKLEKYRNLKTAMMQQLLTGKIRLK